MCVCVCCFYVNPAALPRYSNEDAVGMMGNALGTVVVVVVVEEVVVTEEVVVVVMEK